ncbi:PQQ-like beta-propeller repeat protein, partial [Candidatus Roizmanbacteria bacterium]|nr:PQQ-like beta-propeller repeat protein [Candidatus Roizmanbacteria bacterium]
MKRILVTFLPLTGIIGIAVFLLSIPSSQSKPSVVSSVSAQSTYPPSTDWYTLGANPQRTSAVASNPSNITEIKAVVRPEWFFHISPYISAKVQLIATNDTIFAASSRGLYAVKTQGVAYDQTTREAPVSSALKWIYCTSTESNITTGECPSDELPLGNSPTVIDVNGNGVHTAFVGGFDKRIHAMNANTGDKIWVSAPAEAGFHTNPLVVQVNGQWMVIAGNRDGKMYFYDANPSNTSQPVAPLGTFQTQGPILVSPAFKNNIVYFASNDMYAYAVNAATRAQVWKSAKLPGVGLHSFWPVVTTQKEPGGVSRDYVIFQGINSWGNLNDDALDFFGDNSGAGVIDIGARGTVTSSDPWTTVGTETIDVAKISDFYVAKPWRRTYFLLNAAD